LSASRPFFYGSSKHRLNAKGQIAMPKRFRTVVGEEAPEKGFVLVLGERDCIYMYTHQQFGEVKERVRVIAKEENDQEFFRAFLESAHAVDLDRQGRFVLPGTLRKRAGMKGPEVLFIGMDDRIEIWAPHKREDQRIDIAAYEERRQVQARRIFGI
jgi:MraZ protein